MVQEEVNPNTERYNELNSEYVELEHAIRILEYEKGTYPSHSEEYENVLREQLELLERAKIVLTEMKELQ